MSNILFFNHSILQYYEPVSDAEATMIDYAETYENIEKNIDYYAHIPIFQDDENIMEGEKTLNDYKKISDVHGTPYNSEISLWFESSVQNYLSAILCIVILFILFDTENKGIFSVIHSTFRGRSKSAIWHLLSVFLTAVISNMLFNISLLIAACIKTADINEIRKCDTALKWNTIFRMYSVSVVCRFICCCRGVHVNNVSDT